MPPVPALGATAVEIELPNGRILRVPPGFSSRDLERALVIASGAVASTDEAAAPEPCVASQP